MWSFASVLLAANAAATEPEPEPEPLPYPTRGFALGVGLGSLDVVGRVRVDRAVLEPRLGASFSIPSTTPGVWWTGDETRVAGGSVGPPGQRLRLAGVTSVGLDIRGLPHATRRWEVGVIGGLAWNATWNRYDDGAAPEPGDAWTTVSNALTLRAGAGVGFRPGPKSTIGLDLVGGLLGVGVSRTRRLDEPAPDGLVEPAVRLAPSVGLRVFWTFWTDPVDVR